MKTCPAFSLVLLKGQCREMYFKNDSIMSRIKIILLSFLLAAQKRLETFLIIFLRNTNVHDLYKRKDNKNNGFKEFRSKKNANFCLVLKIGIPNLYNTHLLHWLATPADQVSQFDRQLPSPVNPSTRQSEQKALVDYEILLRNM
jgi:hypothetical protein